MKVTNYQEIVPYTTEDGSTVRELIHPEVHGNSNLSVAEATVPMGICTKAHIHKHTEEVYHITRGSGVMRLGEQHFKIEEGDTICIRPGMPHSVENTGTSSLKILCCCSPAYSHEDTVLLGTE